MKITKEMWDRYAASNSKKRKKSATLRAIHDHVSAVRAGRMARKGGDVLARTSPAWRLDRQRLMRRLDQKAQYERAAAELAKATRQSLYRAARVARASGYEVRASADRQGRVSSYYARRGSTLIRISDHELPATPKRDDQARHFGGSPFTGEIIVEDKMSETRLRRLLILAGAGRSHG